MAKKFQKSTEYSHYDLDNDGIITDEELEQAKSMQQTERELRKSLAQLRMARYTLISMGLYISGAGIVGAYMGTTAWMNRK